MSTSTTIGSAVGVIPLHGKLMITVHRARFLPSRASSCDPFFTAHLKQEEFKSVLCTNKSTEPVWEQSFVFNVNADSNALFRISVKGSEFIGHRKFGEFAVSIGQLLRRCTRQWLQLLDTSSFEKRGEIEVTIDWIPAEATKGAVSPLERAPSFKHAKLIQHGQPDAEPIGTRTPSSSISGVAPAPVVAPLAVAPPPVVAPPIGVAPPHAVTPPPAVARPAATPSTPNDAIDVGQISCVVGEASAPSAPDEGEPGESVQPTAPVAKVEPQGAPVGRDRAPSSTYVNGAAPHVVAPSVIPSAAHVAPAAPPAFEMQPVPHAAHPPQQPQHPQQPQLFLSPFAAALLRKEGLSTDGFVAPSSASPASTHVAASPPGVSPAPAPTPIAAPAAAMHHHPPQQQPYQPYPAQPYAAQPYPAQPYAAQPYPTQPLYPAQPYTGQPAPYPGQPAPYPGQPTYPLPAYPQAPHSPQQPTYPTLPVAVGPTPGPYAAPPQPYAPHQQPPYSAPQPYAPYPAPAAGPAAYSTHPPAYSQY